MSRSFWLPTSRNFSLSGTARLSALIPDNVIDSLLAGPKAFGGAVIGSNERLPGDLNARAVFAFDDNPKTFWSPGFDAKAQIGAWIQVSLRHSVSFDHLNLKVIADGRHSVPTRIRITTDTGGDELVALPPIRDRKAPNSVVSVPLRFPRLSGSTIRFTIEAVRSVTTINWYSTKPITMPVGLAEVGLPGVHFTPESPSAPIPSVCRSDLLRIDGRRVSIRISGSVGAAEKLQGLTVSGCGPDAKGISLGAGTHTLDATSGKITGWDLDRLVLDSAPGGAALAALPSGMVPSAPGTIGTPSRPSLPAPTIAVLASTASSAKLRVQGATAPFWLVLGESLNSGWEATGPDGRSLGPPQLIDGYANAWYVTPAGDGAFTVTLQFGPQRMVTPAIFASAATLALCLLLGFVPFGAVRRRFRRGGAHWAEHRGPPTARPGTTTLAFAGTHRLAAGGEGAPVLGSPLATGGSPPSLMRSLLVAAVSGGVALAMMPPLWAIPVAGATALAALAAQWWSVTRSLLSLTAVGCFAATGAVAVLDQVRYHYPPGSSWPANFESAGVLAFAGVVALSADAIVELTHRHRLAARDGGDDGVGDDRAGSDREVDPDDSGDSRGGAAPET
jgi:hypothetical protein